MNVCVCVFVSACVCESGSVADCQVLMCKCCACAAGTHTLAAFQDEAAELSSQIQILTVGHSAGHDSNTEVQSKAVSHAQSKQDLRVTMLKKGTQVTTCLHAEEPVEGSRS